MDDGLGLGPDVWGTPAEATTLPPPSSIAESSTAGPGDPDDGFQGFNDFGGSAPTDASNDALEDEFADFGDFGEAENIGPSSDFGVGQDFEEDVSLANPFISTQTWEPLRLYPRPSRDHLQEQVEGLVSLLWADEDIAGAMTDDDIRQVEGLKQILVTPESRTLYEILFSQPPATQPVNWTRSRIRRQYLISLGIPVNLDEVLPRANSKPLPALQISTRPMSAPPTARNGVSQSNGHAASASNSRTGTPRSGTPQPGRGDTATRLGLGPKPELDEVKVTELLETNPESLTLVPLPKLEAQLAELRKQTASASAVLTWLLQTRDALQQDSETYNKLIGELIGEAQKAKGPAKGRAPSRRGTGG